jgi:spectinomycin phosphotransferase
MKSGQRRERYREAVAKVARKTSMRKWSLVPTMAAMLTRPEHLTDKAIAAAVAAHWSIAAERLEYAPIGFGSHHWVLTERTGRCWFVTGDAVADSSQRLSGLTAALNTTYALRHKYGLKFVIAPQAGGDGRLLSITGGYAITLYPFVDRLSDATADPQQLMSMIIALHATTPDIGDLTPVDDLRIPDRPTLEAVLADPGTRGDGPYAAAFSDLLWQHRTQICESFACYDTMAASLGEEQQTWVITHGEPKADNTLITASGPVLVDWDTVQLAPPARDIWMTESVDTYTAATGRQVPAEQLEFYRLRWDLSDLCSFGSWFTGPHRRTADTELGWQGSIEICRRLARMTT